MNVNVCTHSDVQSPEAQQMTHLPHIHTQAMQPAVRLLLLLARITDKAAAPKQQSAGTHSAQIPDDALASAMAVTDAAMAVLMLSPPGVCVFVCERERKRCLWQKEFV